MSAKTVLKIVWFVAITIAIIVFFASLGSDSYSLRADEELNIRISPLKKIKVIQLVETEEEFPVEYRFVNSTESFDIYSHLDKSVVHESKEVFGGSQEAHFWAIYDATFSVDDATSGTTVGVRSSYPIGVEITPAAGDIWIYSLMVLWLGFVFGCAVFSLD
ncbi:MAG: hypothetical protein WCY37_04135 [Candidatus Dojkabacteria bacterium]